MNLNIPFILLAILRLRFVESYAPVPRPTRLLPRISSSHRSNNVSLLKAIANEHALLSESSKDVHEQASNKDSLIAFSKDIKHVLHELRGSPTDPTIPKLFRNAKRLSYSNTWTLEDWERHYSRRRYFRYIIKFPKSRLLSRTAPQMITLTLWSILSIWIEDKFIVKKTVPLTSLGIVSSFVAFLLTMRSNMGLSRLDEGRKLWSKVVLQSREMAHLISAFIYPHDKQLALMLARHVACFGWLLKSQLRFVSEDDIASIVNTMLPNKTDASYVMNHRQKPIAVVMRIRQAIHYLGKQGALTTAEEMALDHTAHSLSEVVTSTGRIRASPIPTLYTSHTTRLLTFYLFFLPPALYWSGLDAMVTILVTWAVGFAMLGLDELSHLCEQPFRRKLFSSVFIHSKISYTSHPIHHLNHIYLSSYANVSDFETFDDGRRGCIYLQATASRWRRRR